MRGRSLALVYRSDRGASSSLGQETRTWWRFYGNLSNGEDEKLTQNKSWDCHSTAVAPVTQHVHHTMSYSVWMIS